MVRPHPDWSDHDTGYKRDKAAILVLPSIARYREHGMYREAGVDRQDANSFTVSVECATPLGDDEQLASFADEIDAWEFANGVMWYLSERGNDPQFALKELAGTADPYEDSWIPEGIIEEREPEEVLRKMAGHYEYVLDEVFEAQGTEL